MSYTSINTVSGSVSDVETSGFKSVAKLKLGNKMRIGINQQEGNDDDGYTERSCIITAIVPSGSNSVYISFLGVYADNAIELNLNQFIKVVK